jgi:hypothetical protein
MLFKYRLLAIEPKQPKALVIGPEMREFECVNPEAGEAYAAAEADATQAAHRRHGIGHKRREVRYLPCGPLECKEEQA